MLKTILVPVDGSGDANHAIDYASDLASKYHAKVVLLHAINYPSGRLPDELHNFAVSEHLDEPDEVGAMVEKILESAEVRAMKAGATEIAREFRDGDPAEVILDAVKSFDVDTIVMGSRGFSEMKGLLVGSVSLKILHDTEVPVTIVR